MRFGVFKTAKKNAGDYLINQRCVEILQYLFHDCSIEWFPIFESAGERLELLNQCDAVIAPGGPFTKDQFPNVIRLVNDLSQITRPMIGIGLGWWGKTSSPQEILNYGLTASSVEYFKRLESSGKIGCRDWYSVNVLKAHGLNAIMTGCPAWYDMSYVQMTELSSSVSMAFRRIAISDPAKRYNKWMVIPLVKCLQERYPEAEIHFVFHRGISADAQTGIAMGTANEQLQEQLKKMGIHIHDISYSCEGMNIYDECDLHIGFRVHAHLYNLSHRRLSILLEEDGRGAGANDALGLCGIPVFTLPLYSSPEAIDGSVQENMVRNQVSDLLRYLEESNFASYSNAFRIIRDTFEVMCNHITDSIQNI